MKLLVGSVSGTVVTLLARVASVVLYSWTIDELGALGRLPLDEGIASYTVASIESFGGLIGVGTGRIGEDVFSLGSCRE